MSVGIYHFGIQILEFSSEKKFLTVLQNKEQLTFPETLYQQEELIPVLHSKEKKKSQQMLGNSGKYVEFLGVEDQKCCCGD